jgi:6-phosphogluconolactonase (cycloisomerase 2 family)
VGSVDGLRSVRSVTVSPDGKHIYTVSDFDGAVAAFDRNSATGELTLVETEKDGVGGVDGLAGAYGVTISLDGNHVYVASVTDDAVSVFSRDSTTGELTFIEVQKDGLRGVDGLDRAFSASVRTCPKLTPHIYK